MKKSRMTALMVAIVLAISTVVGCGAKENQKEVIKKSITEELDSVKNLDEKFMEDCIEAAGASELEAMGIDPEEFVKTYLSDFDYTVGDITVEDEKATVNVTLKCKDFTAYAGELEKAATEMLTDMEEMGNLSKEEVKKKMAAIILDSMSGLEVKETEPIAVEYELVDGKWVVSSDSEQKITNSLFSM